jgi:hypothetical protein
MHRLITRGIGDILFLEWHKGYFVEVEDESGGEIACIKVEHGEGMPNLIAGLLFALAWDRGEINFHRGRVGGNVQPFKEECIGP